MAEYASSKNNRLKNGLDLIVTDIRPLNGGSRALSVCGQENILVIEVNYRTPTMIVDGLSALEHQREEFPNLTVVVVDNFSNDGSVKIIRGVINQRLWSDWVTLIEMPKNGGFAYANNHAFTYLSNLPNTPDFVWLLNPDTIVRKGALKYLVNKMRNYPDSICGSRLEDQSGEPQVSCFGFPGILYEASAGFKLALFDSLFKRSLGNRCINKPDWLAGASLMLSYATLLKLGPLDETYFLYFEEVDYLRRARSMGHCCLYVAESRVVHHVGASSGISDTRKNQPRRPNYWFESRRHYYLKNHGHLYLLLADIAFSFGYATWFIRKKIVRSPDLEKEPIRFLRDFLRHSQLNPKQWFS